MMAVFNILWFYRLNLLLGFLWFYVLNLDQDFIYMMMLVTALDHQTISLSVSLNNPQKLDRQRPGSNGRFQCESGEIPTSWLLGTQDEIEMEWKYSFSALSIRLSNSLHSLLHLARTYNCRTRFQFSIWFLSAIERGKETEIWSPNAIFLSCDAS